MNLSELEKEIVDAFLVGKEIELLDPLQSDWYTEKKLHLVLGSINDGCNWRVKKKIKTVEYGVYLNRFVPYYGGSSDISYIEPVLWANVNSNSIICPTYQHVENISTFVKWLTKGTYEIEEQ